MQGIGPLCQGIGFCVWHVSGAGPVSDTAGTGPVSDTGVCFGAAVPGTGGLIFKNLNFLNFSSLRGFCGGFGKIAKA